MHDLSSFGMWELVPIGLFALWVTQGPHAWEREPILSSAAVLVIVIGMLPAFDIAARHSVWLHCLQSALIHHVAPILMLLASANQPPLRDAANWDGRLMRLLVVIGFGVMSGIWMLPQLHLRLMEDPDLYVLMKWAMALSGVFLCKLMARDYQSGDILRSRRLSFSLSVAIPQLLVGLALLISSPLYAMPAHDMAHMNGMMDRAMNPRLDQSLGGLLLCMSAFLLLWIDHGLYLNRLDADVRLPER
jgi:hypothetical protein